MRDDQEDPIRRRKNKIKKIKKIKKRGRGEESWRGGSGTIELDDQILLRNYLPNIFLGVVIGKKISPSPNAMVQFHYQ